MTRKIKNCYFSFCKVHKAQYNHSLLKSQNGETKKSNHQFDGPVRDSGREKRFLGVEGQNSKFDCLLQIQE